MTHTPGPWAADWSKYTEGTFVVKAGMPSNRVIASFDGDGDGPDDQEIADARLIAAAPDMLAALKHAAACYKSYDRFQMDVDAMADIEAAIAKAEGA